MNRPALLLSLLCMAVPAHADETPAFDRPGIAFSTATVPPGGMSYEQGLPDFEFSSAGGTRTRGYSAATNLRLGLASSLELQVSGSAYNVLRTSGAPGRRSQHGAGDLGLALKLALPSDRPALSWAVLAAASFATGDDAFSAGATQVDLGATLGVELGGHRSAALYANVSRLHGINSYTFSPSLGFAVSPRWSAFVEAGYRTAKAQDDTAVAGGGLTWMATPTVQLDLSADVGLTPATPDLQGGFGVSIYFP